MLATPFPLSIPLIIRRARLKEVVGMSPAQIDKMEKAGKFPKRRQWTDGIVGWSGEEVAAWVAQNALEVCPRKKAGHAA